MGITHRRAVVTLYGACILLATSAVTIALGRDWEIGLGLLGASVVFVGLIRAVRSIDLSSRAALLEPENSPLRQALPAVLDQLARAREPQDTEQGLETLRVALDGRAIFLEVDGQEPLVLAGERAQEVTTHRFRVADGETLVLEHDVEFVLAPTSELLVQVIADQLGVTLAQLRRNESQPDTTEDASKVIARRSRVAR
jgi:hypothetical protein